MNELQRLSRSAQTPGGKVVVASVLLSIAALALRWYNSSRGADDWQAPWHPPKVESVEFK